ncbi:MAG: UbiD family decarboxylase [Betaproteobacteria bacterium]|nr:UbiD family decarboxylase [Betaproteobacteria bacterium]
MEETSTKEVVRVSPGRKLADNETAGARPPRDVRDWLQRVDAAGELKRIDARVDLDQELSAIACMAAQREDAPALLFSNFTERAEGQVLINMLGASASRYAISVGLDPTLSTTELITESRRIMGRKIAPVEIAPDKAPVNEIVLTGEDIDLTRLPVPKFWPGDGGRYIGTGDITFTRDPDTSRINVGVYRQMLHGPRKVGMYTSPGKHGGLDRDAWWAKKAPCPVVVAFGIDPILFMVGAQVFGSQESELDVAGGLLGEGVQLTKGVVVDLPIPAHAEIVIEGYLHPDERQMEGPLGEFTGYYGNERAPQPVIDVKALHMRRNPILTASLMARYPACEIGAYYAIMRSARIWDSLDLLGVPGIRGVYAHPAAASGWGMVVVSLKQQFAGHVSQVLSLTAQCPAAAYYTKWIIAVDDDVDPTDFNQVLWALSTRCNPIENIDILRNTWSTGLDPSQVPRELRPYGSKALIDACKPHRHLKDFPKATMLDKKVYERVASRWQEFGLDGTPPVMSAFDDGIPPGKK